MHAYTDAMRAWLCAVALVAACGGGVAGGSGDDDPEPDAAVDEPDGGTEVPWTTLIERNWQIPSYAEGYRCVSLKVTEDMYVASFRVKAPLGTHHAVLTASTTPFSMPGSYNCTSAESNGKQLLYAGGIGTPAFALPAGVAIKIPANTYINLNIHVANYSETTASGTTGIEVQLVAETDVVHVADMTFLGKSKFSIPPTNQPEMVSNLCQISTKWTITSLWPHMHNFAKHQRVYIRRSGGAIVDVLDVDYSYSEQKHYPMTFTVNPGDQLHIQCTYVNDTSVTNPPGYPIEAGDGAGTEMCLAGFFKYPPGGDIYHCVEDFGT